MAQLPNGMWLKSASAPTVQADLPPLARRLQLGLSSRWLRLVATTALLLPAVARAVNFLRPLADITGSKLLHRTRDLALPRLQQLQSAMADRW